VDAATPVDAQNAPTGVWKSRNEREIPTASTSIIFFSEEQEERRTKPLRSTVHKNGSPPLGGGKKLFVDGSAPHSYKLTRSRVSSTGLMIAHYERGGEVKVADTALAEPSKAEAARQERMKREG
jgi:hypothetical protein